MYVLRRWDVIQKPNPSRCWIRKRIGFRDRASIRKNIGWVRTQPNHLNGSYFSGFFRVRITCPDFPQNIIRIPDCCRRIKFLFGIEKELAVFMSRREVGWGGGGGSRPGDLIHVIRNQRKKKFQLDNHSAVKPKKKFIGVCDDSGIT